MSERIPKEQKISTFKADFRKINISGGQYVLMIFCCRINKFVKMVMWLILSLFGKEIMASECNFIDAME